jgi:Tfp pilus assembly PilM family ATPase
LGSDVVRMMQIRGTKDRYLQSAVEVVSSDSGAIKVALSSFNGKKCVVSIASSEVLVQHVRVPIEADENEIRNSLMQHDKQWAGAEIRHTGITTTGSSGKPRQEMLCVGIDSEKIMKIISIINEAGGEVLAVTVPLYASLRAFDQLYRRDGDEKITSLLIDMDEDSSVVMIAHGANCVFAHRVDLVHKIEIKEVETKQDVTQSLKPITTAVELERCLRHHDALFPERAVDRVIFTGQGATNTEKCAAIASKLGIAGYVSDPSAWVEGAKDYVSNPAWTTSAGICMRYAEEAA